MAPYRQHIPDIGLSLEHDTENTRDSRGWFLFSRGEELGRYASQAAARQAWKDALEAAGWTPKRREIDASEVFRKVATERWARNRAG